MRGSIWAKVPTAPEIAQVATSLRAAARRSFARAKTRRRRRELEPERGRLGMNAVRAADGRRQLVLARAALDRGVERVDVGDENIGGPHQLDVKASVEHVGGGHPLMHEARVRPDELGQMGEEGDDVVLDLALDLVDARDVEFYMLCPWPRFPRPPLSGSCRARPWRRRRGPRSRTRCETASAAPRSSPFRAWNTAVSSPPRGKPAV